MVQALLAAGADLKARNKWSGTPLHIAAGFSANPTVVQALLAAGADPTAKTWDGKTPFDLLQENDKLKGTDVYWRMNDLQYE